MAASLVHRCDRRAATTAAGSSVARNGRGAVSRSVGDLHRCPGGLPWIPSLRHAVARTEADRNRDDLSETRLLRTESRLHHTDPSVADQLLRRARVSSECIKRRIAASASSLSPLHRETCRTEWMRSSAPSGRSKAVRRLVDRAPSEAMERACRTGRPGPASRAVPSSRSGRARRPAARPNRPR